MPMHICLQRVPGQEQVQVWEQPWEQVYVYDDGGGHGQPHDGERVYHHGG